MSLAKFLPDPDDTPGRDVVIFDGKCQLCTGGVQWLASIDKWTEIVLWPARLSFLSLHDQRVAERFPDLTYDRLMQEMVVVDRHGNRHGGSDAVRYFTRRLPPLWPLMPLLHLPGSAGLWRRLYHLLAKNRYRWNRHHCDEGSCELHFGMQKRSPKTTTNIQNSTPQKDHHHPS